MLVKYKHKDIDFFYDTKDLGKVQLPLYNAHVIKRFYLTSGKAISMPIKFSLEAKKADVFLRATVITPEDCDEMTAKIALPKFSEMIANCVLDNISLPSNKTMESSMQALANALSQAFDSCDEKLLVLKEAYDYPAFIVKCGEVIGIGEKTTFNETSLGLNATFANMQGPYMSMPLADAKVEIVTLNDNLEPLVTLRGDITGIAGYNLTVKCELKKATKENVKMCQDIAERYDNPMEYFFEKQGVVV